MSNSIYFYVLVTVTIFTLNLENAKGANVPALITAFNNFFAGLDEICGNMGEIPRARETYHKCIENITTYDELTTCAQTAFITYYPFAMRALGNHHQTVLNLKSNLSAAILLATKDEPPERQLIPIEGVQNLGMGASSVQLTSQGRRHERG